MLAACARINIQACVAAAVVSYWLVPRGQQGIVAYRSFLFWHCLADTIMSTNFNQAAIIAKGDSAGYGGGLSIIGLGRERLGMAWGCHSGTLDTHTY